MFLAVEIRKPQVFSAFFNIEIRKMSRTTFLTKKNDIKRKCKEKRIHIGILHYSKFLTTLYEGH